MLLLQRKDRKAPFALITLILLFGRKKEPEETNRPPQPPDPKLEPFPIPDSLKKTVTGSDVSRARDRLRLASLERDIIGDALTKIYEAETRGQINESEKNQLVQRYKTDLKRVDGEVDTHKKTVDLYDLESAKEDLLKSFHEKMLEIDLKINQIKPTVTLSSIIQVPDTQTPPKPETAQPAPPPSQNNPPKERQPREKPRNKAEERLETIREEVLKAMERLEQIETEG
jgi:hypothetical protein